MVKTALLLMICASLAPILAQGKKANVLVLMADDLGWGDLSSNGNQEVATPNLDLLAESGMRFEKFYACPNGSATSASFLTGRYHYRTGVSGESALESMMYDTEFTLAEAFSENGYATSYFGRWHHGENWPQTAKAQGFQFSQEGSEPASVTEHLNSIVGGKKPFFSQIYLPHPRLVKGDIKKELKSLDQKVGELLEWLINSGQAENTIVLFLSDNGPDFSEGKPKRFNGYFHGGRGSVHEGGLRVPCLISWPGKIAANSKFTRITFAADWMPTLVGLCELKVPADIPNWDGANLSAPLKNAGDSTNWPNRVLFHAWTPPGYQWRKASVSVRTDRWVALRDPRWRRDDSVVERQSGWELYDLNKDPSQKKEMGTKFPFLLSELRADFTFLMDQTTDDGLGPIPIEIGHSQSARVKMPVDGRLEWTIKVIEPGKYRFTVEGDAKRYLVQQGVAPHLTGYTEPVYPVKSLTETQQIEVNSGEGTVWELGEKVTHLSILKGKPTAFYLVPSEPSLLKERGLK